ncbi:transcriptional repressor LexA [Ketobacter alkanivorans]|nr:transcriptional repressor LexA [Ketobacter alkanivorans]
MKSVGSSIEQQHQQRTVQLSDVSLSHAQFMHWIAEFNQATGSWPDLDQVQAAPLFEQALLDDLQCWSLVAWDAEEHLVAVEQWISLPVVGSVAAGVPIEAIENHQGQLSLPLNLFRERPTYLLRVRGDSMKDAGILDGDLIAVRKTENVGEGKIIVARVDNEVTVKRLKLDGGQVALMPENANYEPIMVAPEELVVEGLFVGVIRERNRLH